MNDTTTGYLPQPTAPMPRLTTQTYEAARILHEMADDLLMGLAVSRDEMAMFLHQAGDVADTIGDAIAEARL